MELALLLLDLFLELLKYIPSRALFLLCHFLLLLDVACRGHLNLDYVRLLSIITLPFLTQLVQVIVDREASLSKLDSCALVIALDVARRFCSDLVIVLFGILFYILHTISYLLNRRDFTVLLLLKIQFGKVTQLLSV